MGIETLDMPIQQLVVSALIADGLPIHPDNVKVMEQYHIEMMARQLTIMLTVPTVPIQDRVITTYPTTWWDHVKERLGWKHDRTEVNLKQYLVAPEIPAALRGKHLRIATFADVNRRTWNEDGSFD